MHNNSMYAQKYGNEATQLHTQLLVHKEETDHENSYCRRKAPNEESVLMMYTYIRVHHDEECC